MAIRKDCIHLRCRFLNELILDSVLDHREPSLHPVYDKCALNLITPLCGCNPICASYEVH